MSVFSFHRGKYSNKILYYHLMCVCECKSVSVFGAGNALHRVLRYDAVRYDRILCLVDSHY